MHTSSPSRRRLCREFSLTSRQSLKLGGAQKVSLDEALILAPEQGVVVIAFSGHALTYISTRGVVSNIWTQPITGGPPKQLTDLKPDRIFSFDWSRDGKWLAFSRGIENRDVMLISNFK